METIFRLTWTVGYPARTMMIAKMIKDESFETFVRITQVSILISNSKSWAIEKVGCMHSGANRN